MTAVEDHAAAGAGQLPRLLAVSHGQPLARPAPLAEVDAAICDQVFSRASRATLGVIRTDDLRYLRAEMNRRAAMPGPDPVDPEFVNARRSAGLPI